MPFSQKICFRLNLFNNKISIESLSITKMYEFFKKIILIFKINGKFNLILKTILKTNLSLKLIKLFNFPSKLNKI